MEIRFAECSLDLERRQLRRSGEPVHLSPKAFDLLSLLVERGPAAVSKAELLERLWGDVVVEEANLPNLVREIRLAIGDAERERIRTVQRFGYAFELPVRRAEGGAAPRPLAALVHGGARVLLGAGVYRLGRDTDSPLPLDSLSVSRFHARLEVREEGATIEDLNSKNGLWVSGRRVRGSAALGDRESLRLGDVTVAWTRLASASTETAQRESG